MGRPLKDATHPLARLRGQLSSSNQCTRKKLSEKTGVPEATIKDVELGKFKLTTAVAMKIALGTRADPKSLLNGDDPILDFCGESLSESSTSLDYLPESLHAEARRQLFEAVWDAAVEKARSELLSYSFDNWIATTVKSLWLRGSLEEKITEKVKLFLVDPDEIPSFRPKNRELAAQWKGVEDKIDQEQVRVYKERGSAVPMFFCRTPAIKNLREKKSRSSNRRAA
jgi:transcriptional regulator with XRE-family HTH domain